MNVELGGAEPFLQLMVAGFFVFVSACDFEGGYHFIFKK